MERNDLDKMMDFLSQRLGKEERDALERDLASKPQSDQEKAVQKAMLNYVDQSGDREMRDWLKTVIPKYEATQDTAPTKPLRRSPLRWLVPLAAAIALLLFVVLPGTFQSQLSASEIAAAQLQAYELSFGDRGTPQDDLLQAGQYYQAGRYAEAIPLLQKAAQESEDGKYRLALGISQLLNEQPDSAIKSLQALIDLPDPVYQAHARWYTALAYLQQEQPAKAAPFLQLLAQKSRAFNSTKAKALLEEKIFMENK